ncbi:MAG: hypothetical protein GY856_36720 [bacterium]|nr:hypothetical protein [bacterium]
MAYWSQSKTGVPVKDSEGGDLSLATRSVDSQNVLMTEELASGTVQELLHRYLDTVGDGSGTKNAAVDHSGAAEEYMLEPPDDIFRVTKLWVFIRDGAAFNANGYGGISASPLTNGINVKVKDSSGDVLDLLHAVPVKCNAHWLHHGTMETLSPFGTGDDLMVVTLDFAATGTVVRLNSALDEYLAVILEDDFSALVEHYFVAEGFVE